MTIQPKQTILSTQMRSALNMWIGVYSAIAEPRKAIGAMSMYAADKVTALECFTADKQGCAELPKCVFRTTRCVPAKSEHGMVGHINDANNGNVCRVVGVVPIYPMGGNDSGMYSAVVLRGEDVLMVSFPSGDVHHASDILAHARAFVAAFLADGIPIAKGRLALALVGHSEGSVLAEAVAFEMATSEDADVRALARETLLIGTGSHLWATPEQVETITQAFGGRMASFVVAKGGSFDGMATHLKEVDAGGVEYDEVVSLPHTVVMHDNGASCGVGSFSVNTSSVECGGKALYPDRAIHHWQTYRPALERMLEVSNTVGGKSARGSTCAWVVGTSFICTAIACVASVW